MDIIKLSIIVLLLDIITLKYIIGPYFGDLINKIQSSPMKMNYISAIIAYILIIASIYIFIINNNFTTNKKYILAFLLGIFIHGIYETTNKAIIKDWTWKAVIIDTIWGGLLYLISTYLFYL
jgi:uncharacterized membrane protein